MTISERIKEIADREGVTIHKIEREIGASTGVISRSIKNGTDIQSKWLSKIVEKYPKYNPTWLLTGKGEIMNDHISSRNVSQTAIGGINIAGGAEGNKVSVKNGDDSDKQKILKKDYQKLEKENQKLKEKILRLEKQIDKLFGMVGDK